MKTVLGTIVTIFAIVFVLMITGIVELHWSDKRKLADGSTGRELYVDINPVSLNVEQETLRVPDVDIDIGTQKKKVSVPTIEVVDD